MAPHYKHTTNQTGIYSTFLRLAASSHTSATWPFCTMCSSTISLFKCERVLISKSRNDLMDFTSVAPAFIESRTFLSMCRIRDSAFSSWYSTVCPYRSDRFDMGRTVVRTVSSRVRGERGRNEVTMVIRSWPPKAFKAWWSIYRPCKMTPHPYQRLVRLYCSPEKLSSYLWRSAHSHNLTTAFPQGRLSTNHAFRIAHH